MFRKLCNYAAILSLSLVFTGSSVLAKSPSSKVNKMKTTNVSGNKKFNYYQKLITVGEDHSYKITVDQGKTAKILVKTPIGVSVKVKTPVGETKTYEENKAFEINISEAGVYEVILGTSTLSRYSMDVVLSDK